MPLADFQSALAEGVRLRRMILERTNEITENINKTELENQLVAGIPALNLPETLEKRSFIRIRLFQSLFGQRPIASFTPVKGLDQTTGISWRDVAREYTEFFDMEARKVLNVVDTMRSSICEMADYGIGGWKVTLQPNPEFAGRVMPYWDFVSIRDFIWPDGLGLNVQKFPWCGQFVRLTIPEIDNRIRQGIYADTPELRKIMESEECFDENPLTAAWNEVGGYEGMLPSAPYDRTFIEVWFYDRDGKLKVGDMHAATGYVAREIDAPYGNKKPFFFARLDERSAATFLGTGVGDKLEVVNKVVNGVFNTALASSIVANQQVKLIRTNSDLEKQLFGENRHVEITPNFQATTQNPESDLRIIPLGDPRAAAVVIGLLPILQRYSDRMFGSMDAQMGNVASTRRSPSYGVTAVLEEGSMPIKDILTRIAQPFSDAVFFTTELYEQARMEDRVMEVLGDDGEVIVKAMMATRKLRQALACDVKVIEPASSRDAEMQRTIGQYQMVANFSSQLIQIGNMMANPQIPESVKRLYEEVMLKQGECLRRALEAAGNIQDISKLLADVGSLFGPVIEETNQIQEMLAQQAQAQAQLQAQAGGMNAGTA